MISTMESLEEVLADARGELPVLQKRNGVWTAKDVEEFVDRVAAATEEWTTWLSEGDAVVRSGYAAATLRARFESLRRDNNARLVGRARQYRACAIPRRANVIDAAARGREAARALRKIG